jgi:multidrug efflux pump subunit AcrA (membrane-fusion protein)
MTKYLLLLLPLLGFSSNIKVEHAQLRPLGKIIQTNAQITQLSDQQQEIVSRLSGHLEAYYVKPGQHVKKGDKVVLIASIELSKMTAEYLALIQQFKAVSAQKDTVMTLNKKGLASQNDVSNAIIALEGIRSKQNALTSQLKSLGVNPDELKEATDQFILYAHDDGVVGKILAPLHSNVNAQTALVTLVNQDGYFAIAYLGVEDAMKVSKETKGWIDIAGKSYPSSFMQLLPNIDNETQRAKVLFEIQNSPSNLLLGAFTQMDISLAPMQNVVMVKKSALTLFNGEWVVFVEKGHEEASGHDEKSNDKKEEAHGQEDHDHDAHGHDDHDHDAHKEDKEHQEHENEAHEEEEEGHDEHEDESPYEAKAVQVIAYAGEYAAVEGLEAGEEYVSDGVYFVKSMLLKSSLGEHGH